MILAGVEPVTVEDKAPSEPLEVSVQVGDEQAQVVKKPGAVEAEDEVRFATDRKKSRLHLTPVLCVFWVQAAIAGGC